jgi:hypothetical protein
MIESSLPVGDARRIVTEEFGEKFQVIVTDDHKDRLGKKPGLRRRRGSFVSCLSPTE